MGYDSDTSVLKVTNAGTAEMADVLEAKVESEGTTATTKTDAQPEGTAGDEAGTPPPVEKPSVGETTAAEEPGTPPPPPTPAAAPASKSLADATSPGTPKRPREDEAEDVAMQEGEATKRPRVE